MPFGSRQARASRSHSQRGQAMLLVVLLLAVGIGVFAYGAVSSVSLSQQQDLRTRLALVQVRDALIGWSVARTTTVPLPNARPGELPCPDMDNNGFEDGSCVAGAIGRVPWKTLGIPEPKDAAGETLWYAIAGPFRIWNVNNNPIHSDTKGNLTVNQGDYNVVTEVYSLAGTITSEAVAVVFSPGATLGAQERSCTGDPNVPNCQATRVCTGPTYTLTALCNPANYLESAAGINNSTTNGPFISAPSSYKPSPGFNDKVMAITTSDLMPIVEQRVAREVINLLNLHKLNSTCACYPWPDMTVPWTGEGDNDAFRGALPLTAGDPHAWGTSGTPDLALPAWSWLLDNQWWRVIYYAVAPSKTETPTAGDLTVDGSGPYNVVLIMPGPAGSGPLGNLRPSFNWTHYVDDAANSNSDNDYVTPSSTAYVRDRLYTIAP